MSVNVFVLVRVIFLWPPFNFNINVMGISSQASGGAVKVNYTIFIAYMVLLSAFGSFVNDTFVPSLPSMCKFFGCTVPMAQMGLSTGMMGLGVGQLILGPLSDHLGRKPVLYASTGLFFIAAIVSVFSPTIHFFLGCRFSRAWGPQAVIFSPELSLLTSTVAGSWP